MSVGPLGGIAGSLAGSPLAQTSGSETDRARQDSGVRERRLQNDEKAETAAGIGETDGDDHETADRDADGRRPWELPPDAPSSDNAGPSSTTTPPDDPRGESGGLLDLTG